MATDRQRARRRAQRETAKAVRQFREDKKARRQPTFRIDKSIRTTAREAQDRYAYAVLNGETPYPSKGSKEGNQLARMASLASKGKADPAFFAAFQQYFYHDEKGHESDEADEEYDDYDEDEDEE